MKNDIKTIAGPIPCYNEERTIAKVVRDFRDELPESDIYVYENNSEDKTVEEAGKDGAIVRYVRTKGKAKPERRKMSWKELIRQQE